MPQFKLADRNLDSTGFQQPASMSYQLTTVAGIERPMQDLGWSWLTDFQILSPPMLEKMKMKVLVPIPSCLSVYSWTQRLV